MRGPGCALLLLLGSAGSFASADARAAETCTRPTDAAGYAGYTYESAPALHVDEAHTRIWYVLEGRHRVNPTSTRTDGVPDDVARAAAVTEDALARYAAMGFRAPISDEDPSCGSNGGDGRLDVYLVDFTSSDGTAVPERCTKSGNANRCASFILAESNFAGAHSPYSSADEGIRTVLAHEVFHAVQNAYDTGMDRFWAEGTAQWAADTLSPSLTDLERFLPAFFREPSRALDVPPGTVTGAYLYGAAIWPVYLTEARGDGIVRSILEAESTGAPPLDAADTVLRATASPSPSPSSLASEFTRFAVWNAATGTRASHLGYRNAKDYPMVDLADFPKDGARGILSGLGAFYYRLKLDASKELVLDADPARVMATVIPMDGATARIDRALALAAGSSLASRARLDGESIVVVNGITTSKVDAPFALSLHEPPPPKEPAPPKEPNPAAEGGSSGCSVSPRAVGGPTSLSPWALLLGLALFVTACGRSSSTHDSAGGASNTRETSAKSESRPARIVSVGGPVTETVFALGAGDHVVGVDTSSVHPEKANQLPHVGYQRTVAAEGILGLTPTLVLCAEEAGPASALEQIRSTGVRLEIVPSEPSIAGARARIEKVGQILGRDSQKVLTDFDADVAKATALVAKATSRPKVLAIYSRGQNLIHVFGAHSAADSMLRLAGAVNAVSDFDGSKPMAAEAMVQAAPDVILVPSRGLESLGGVAGLAKVPGIAQTAAAKANRFVAMDDLLLLGFGPRTGQAIRELARKVHPELETVAD